MGSTKMETVLSSAAAAKAGAKVYGKIVLTLKNQLLPDDRLDPTPSQQHGLDAETEKDLRIYGCELIQTAGILLKLPQVAMATGQVLLQRYYYSKSLVREPVDQTAMACVCLASKIEEAPRRVRDVINIFSHIRQVTSNKPILPVILDHNYIQLKNQIITAERRVLKELGFCVHIKHPHKIIVMYLQVLGYEKHKQLMQCSWNYMNDSLRTDVFLRYQPETVACACIYLTARKLRLPLPKAPVWYTLFGATEEEIRDICVRILKLYARPKINVDGLEKKVEELCRKYQESKVKHKGSANNTPNHSPHSPSDQKSAGAHNAWGGFISRSGSHTAPIIEKHSRTHSRSPHSKSPSRSRSPIVQKLHHHKRPSKKHAKSRSRSASRNRKKHQKKRSSYSRSRSPTPYSKTTSRRRDKKRSEDREIKNDKYNERYEKVGKEERYSEKDRYDDKKERERYDRYKDDKYRDDKYRDDKYQEASRERERDKHKKGTKDKERESDRSRDRRRRS